jgi:beta-lactam-binding protein with PASTA domain
MRMRATVQRALAVVAFAASAIAHAGVWYDFDVVAETGVSPTASTTILGNGPSINGKGKVAYVGVVSNQADETVYLWSPATAASTDIGLGHPQNRTYGANGTGTVHVNNNDEVVAWTHTFAPQNTYEVRVLNSLSPTGNTVMVRGSSGALPFDLLYANPWINDVRALEDDTQGGNNNGACDAGEVCVPQTVFNAFTSAPARYLGTVVRNPEDAAHAGVQNTVGLDTRQSRPVIADDGRVLVRANLSTNPIVLYEGYALTVQTQIANAAMGFTALGLAPGMTPDAKIVAFAGNRGHGAGIFLSIETSPGNRRLVRIVGENATVPKAELGVDGNNNKLYFATLDVDSRVGVVYTPDYLGAANKSVVVSFVGTPNGASRTNPGTGKPFGFAGTKGLWTIRVDLDAPLVKNVCVVLAPGATGSPFVVKGDDVIVTPSSGPDYVSAGANGICESENTHDTELLFSRSSPIPVAQIGDTIHSSSGDHVVADIAVHDPIAQANFDGALAPRAARNGDHRVVFWASVDGGAKQMIVAGSHLDSDQDGLMDHWETSGIDLDGDGGVDLDLAAMGADPLKRDLFIQLDWTADRPKTLNPNFRHRPIPGIVRKLAQFYASAPALPNGIQAGIVLHVDAGTELDLTGQAYTRNMGSGPIVGGQTYPGAPVDILYGGLPNSVTLSNVNAVSFDTAKSTMFWNHHRGAREYAFLHVVFTDFHHAQNATDDDNVNPAIGAITMADAFSFETAAPSAQSGNFANTSVIITSGTGAGQIRRVNSSAINGGTGHMSFDVGSAFNPIPDSTSTFVIADPSTGEGHAAFRYDNAFAPGRNLAITLGDAGSGPNGELGAADTQFQSFDHEMGHLLSLMHGGIDHDNYKADYHSVMNYAYQFCPAGQNGASQGPGTPAPCPIEGYSGATDAISNNWNNVSSRFSLQFQSLGQAFGAIETAQAPFPPPRESSYHDIVKAYGPLDTTPPHVSIGSPLPGATFATGATIPLSFSATDNVAVVRGEVTFDVNGDGTITDNEIFVPSFTPPGSFGSTIPATSGPGSSRKLSAIAYDAANNPGMRQMTINVGAVPNVVVPNVVNTPQQNAEDAIVAANLAVGTVTFQTSGGIPAGNVISENPAAGQMRSPGTLVALVVSLGPNGVLVPDVTGLSQSAATSAINNAGLAVANVKTIASNDIPGVISQSPPFATIVPPGTGVSLLVSVGQSVSVPNVVGLTQAAASNAIASAGLVVGTVTNAASETVPAGSVISQNPSAGTSVASGSAVDLVVSSGPPPPAQRTFVSPTGADANLCAAAAPCRSFNRAIARAASGGEVIVLASAGYGPANIDKPITIVAVDGVYAGVSVTSGTGIVVNPGSGRVTLIGLSINGLGGTIGIDFQSGDALYIDRCVVGGFTQAGIKAQGAAAAALHIRGSALRENGTGIAAGPSTSALLRVDLDRTKIDRNVNGLTVGGHGAVGTIRSTEFTQNGTGLAIAPSAAGAVARFELRKASFSANGVGVIAGGTAGTTAQLAISNSLVSASTSVGVQTDAGGTTWIADTTITRNATGLAQSGGGSAVSFGDNRLLGNGVDGAFTSLLTLQ